MILHPPFAISARLLPALKINDGWISMEWDGFSSDHRAIGKYHIDIPAGEFSGNDLKSGVGGASLQSMFASLLSFLGAAAESYRYEMQSSGLKGENTDLFPAPVVEWAYRNADEISMMEMEIEEANKPLIE